MSASGLRVSMIRSPVSGKTATPRVTPSSKMPALRLLPVVIIE
jgi:hypothetical protein